MSPALIGVSYRFMFNPEFGVLAKGIGAVFPALEGVAVAGRSPPRHGRSSC